MILRVAYTHMCISICVYIYIYNYSVCLFLNKRMTCMLDIQSAAAAAPPRSWMWWCPMKPFTTSSQAIPRSKPARQGAIWWKLWRFH